MGIGSTPKKKNKAPLMSVQSRKLRFVVKPKKKTQLKISLASEIHQCLGAES